MFPGYGGPQSAPRCISTHFNRVEIAEVKQLRVESSCYRSQDSNKADL